MRRPRFQFGLRTLLIVTVVVAVGSWGVLVAIRARSYWVRAEQAAHASSINRAIAESTAPAQTDGRSVTVHRRYAVQMADYYDRLNEKYRRAAVHPWFVTEPDPPPPAIEDTK